MVTSPLPGYRKHSTGCTQPTVAPLKERHRTTARPAGRRPTGRGMGAAVATSNQAGKGGEREEGRPSATQVACRSDNDIEKGILVCGGAQVRTLVGGEAELEALEQVLGRQDAHLPLHGFR